MAYNLWYNYDRVTIFTHSCREFNSVQEYVNNVYFRYYEKKEYKFTANYWK